MIFATVSQPQLNCSRIFQGGWPVKGFRNFLRIVIVTG
jgi:hypothetical protein